LTKTLLFRDLLAILGSDTNKKIYEHSNAMLDDVFDGLLRQLEAKMIVGK